MTLLENLYHGNVHPANKTFEGNPHYAKYMSILSDSETKLAAYLKSLPDSDAERELFCQMIEAQTDLSSFLELDCFLDGFRLGASMMLETFILPQQSELRDLESSAP